MEISNEQFHICKIFFDETDLPINNIKCFMWGGIFLPVDCDLAVKLGKVRRKEDYIYSIHFSEKKEFKPKEVAVIKGFLKSFLDSSASFRSIVVDVKQWQNIKDWKSKARLVGVLLSHPWVSCEGKVYNILTRPRIIFDRCSLNQQQEKDFNVELNRMLTKKNQLFNTTTRQIMDASMVFANKRIFDELQLIDTLNGIMRISYLNLNSVKIPKTKLMLHDFFLRQFPAINSFVDADWHETKGKLDIWKLKPKN